MGGLHVVYNGEIYNFREIRGELQRMGMRFHTESDTEVLLASWQTWGPSCVARLRGMFAFGLWDEDRRELTLVRDRLGIKPLYYAQVQDAFLFASEVRALLASGSVSRKLDRQAVWDYLAHGSVAEPHSIVRDVRALPPAHMLRVCGGVTTVERYWDVVEATSGARAAAPPAYPEAVEELRRRLECATKYHLVSDVPVGAFLSGGIDSTGVVGLATEVSGSSIRTFSVGFGREHASMDELKWARLVADRFGTEHTEVVVSGAMVGNLLDRAAAALDQPSVDGTNTLVVSQAARQDVVVALSGLGGDELFAGYAHFARFARRARPNRSAQVLRNLAGERATAVLPGRVRSAISDLADTPAQRLAHFRMLGDDGSRRAAVASGFLGLFEPSSAAARTATLLREDLDAVAQVSYAELNGYLRDTLLRDADAMSMAHGLEMRPVLLDHDVVEFAFSLPGEYKDDGGRPKRILVDALADLVPKAVVERRKMGFELPLASWLSGPLKGRALALLDSKAAGGLLSRDFRDLLRRQLHGRRGSSHRLWGVMILLAYIELHGLTLDA
jgi:asparagine synthase (glutamine-hydrolysing)